jgi:hypothetical protein
MQDYISCVLLDLAISRRLSPRRLGFAPRSVHMGFVVDTVTLGQVYLQVLRFLLVIFFHCCAVFTNIV